MITRVAGPCAMRPPPICPLLFKGGQFYRSAICCPNPLNRANLAGSLTARNWWLFRARRDRGISYVSMRAQQVMSLVSQIPLSAARAAQGVFRALTGAWRSFLVLRQNSPLRTRVRIAIARSPQGCAICALGTALFAGFIALSAIRGDRNKRVVGQVGCAAVVITTLFFL